MIVEVTVLVFLCPGVTDAGSADRNLVFSDFPFPLKKAAVKSKTPYSGQSFYSLIFNFQLFSLPLLNQAIPHFRGKILHTVPHREPHECVP